MKSYDIVLKFIVNSKICMQVAIHTKASAESVIKNDSDVT